LWRREGFVVALRRCWKNVAWLTERKVWKVPRVKVLVEKEARCRKRMAVSEPSVVKSLGDEGSW
jgi:hypothetical protein